VEVEDELMQRDPMRQREAAFAGGGRRRLRDCRRFLVCGGVWGEWGRESAILAATVFLLGVVVHPLGGLEELLRQSWERNGWGCQPWVWTLEELPPLLLLSALLHCCPPFEETAKPPCRWGPSSGQLPGSQPRGEGPNGSSVGSGSSWGVGGGVLLLRGDVQTCL